MEEQQSFENVIENKPEYNKKPRLLARILSGLVDIFAVFLVGFIIFQIEMYTPISNQYHATREELLCIIDDTKVATEYGYKLYDDEENYSSYTASYHINKEEDETNEKYGKYYVVVNNAEISKEVKEAYQNAIKNNGQYQNDYIVFRAYYFGMMMIAAGSSELALIFVVPLLNKRRATLGRYVALTTLISNKETKAKWWQLLIRFLFILLIETALPLFYLSEIATVLIVALVDIVMILISKKTGRTFSDYVSFTRVIDKNTFKPINEQ